jgi:hypothetical protein
MKISFHFASFNLSNQINEIISYRNGNFKLDGGAMFGVVPKLFGTKRIR